MEAFFVAIVSLIHIQMEKHLANKLYIYIRIKKFDLS